MSLQSIKPRHILELTTEEKHQFLDSFDMILSDCDGVVWLLLEPIPKTGPAINLLKEAGKEYKFISNNSMRTDEEYLQKFRGIGVESVKKEDLVYPVKAIAKHINEHFPKQTCFVMGCDTFKRTLRENGVNVKSLTPPLDLELEDLPDFVRPTEHVAAVIIDLHLNMTFVELVLAQQYLFHKDCQLIVGVFDGHVPVLKDLTILGPNGFVKILAESCQKEALIFGKPGHSLGQFLLQHFQITQPKRVLFVGDNLQLDVKFGLDLGFQTLFVLSGAHTKQDMLDKPFKNQPDYYADSMADFLPFFDDLNLK